MSLTLRLFMVEFIIIEILKCHQIKCFTGLGTELRFFLFIFHHEFLYETSFLFEEYITKQNALYDTEILLP